MCAATPTYTVYAQLGWCSPAVAKNVTFWPDLDTRRGIARQDGLAASLCACVICSMCKGVHFTDAVRLTARSSWPVRGGGALAAARLPRRQRGTTRRGTIRPNRCRIDALVLRLPIGCICTRPRTSPETSLMDEDVVPQIDDIVPARMGRRPMQTSDPAAWWSIQCRSGMNQAPATHRMHALDQ